MKYPISDVLADSIRGFRLPRYHEIPDMGLYLEQTTKYVNRCISPLGLEAITPSMIRNYVKQGIIAAKIAAHAADIAKKIPHSRDIDDKMADARKAFDWEMQWECAIDSETAKNIRSSRKPEIQESCSMCGKFCAVRSMNKALSGEQIDIL